MLIEHGGWERVKRHRARCLSTRSAYTHGMLFRCHQPPFPISPEDVCHDMRSPRRTEFV